MRLIDADALKESLTETLHRCDEWIENAKDGETRTIAEANYTAFLESILRVKDAPTVDAVPRWIPCEERLPKDLEVVNITWVNHRPVGYYFDIKDKPFTATAIHYEDKWWWYSPICEDMLAECGKSECDKMDADIEVTAWMPLPEPYKGERRDDELQEDNGRCEVPCAE